MCSGPVEFAEDDFLRGNVLSISVCDVGAQTLCVAALFEGGHVSESVFHRHAQTTRRGRPAPSLLTKRSCKCLCFNSTTCVWVGGLSGGWRSHALTPPPCLPQQDGVSEEHTDGEEEVTACHQWVLPSTEFQGVWEKCA